MVTQELIERLRKEKSEVEVGSQAEGKACGIERASTAHYASLIRIERVDIVGVSDRDLVEYVGKIMDVAGKHGDFWEDVFEDDRADTVNVAFVKAFVAAVRSVWSEVRDKL